MFEGAPAENIIGSELEPKFVELGYELFCDKERLGVEFKTGDFFSAEGGVGLDLVEESFDMVHAASFFHLFSWTEQVEAVSKALRLLKPKSGSVLFGRQTGVEVAGSVKYPQTRSGEMWRHDLESWGKLMEEVRVKTGLEFEAKCEWLDKVDKKEVEKAWTRMAFVVTLGEGRKEKKLVPLEGEHSLKFLTT